METPGPRCWTREEFERAGDLGLFGPEERLELISGEIIKKMAPQNSPHITGIRLVEEALRLAFPTGHDIRVQGPLALGSSSQPEPDVAVVTGSMRDYARHHPTTAVLIVEISDSTLRYDRTTKAELYAAAGIPEYWIVNLNDRVLEVHRQPAPMTGYTLGHYYRSVTQYLESESIAPLAAPDHSIEIADLLP